MKNLIDRDEIFDILDERFGFWDFVRDLINKYDLDDYEDSVLRVADDILEGIHRFVESAEIVEEREATNCSCFKREYDIALYYTTKVYLCNNCWENIEIDEEAKELKFCPYCGAQYKIVENK